MSLRHALLGLLADGPASGYDLMKVFDRSLAFVWPATQSQLYGELNRLADDDRATVRDDLVNRVPRLLARPVSVQLRSGQYAKRRGARNIERRAGMREPVRTTCYEVTWGS